MEFPQNLYYTKDHEWISSLSGTAKVGISAYAIEQLGDIVHLELPEIGTTFQAKEPFGTVESTKTVSDLYMPGTGKIIAINEELLDTPEQIQEDPYNKGWLVKIEIQKEISNLMKATEYEAYTRD